MTLQSRVQMALALMLLAQVLQAQPADGQEASASVNGRAAESAGPTLLELLEFIGEFTTEDGDWVDPALLEAGRGPAASRPAERQRGGADAGRTEEPQPAANANCNARPCE